MPLTAIADFEKLGKADPMFADLAQICDQHNGLWNGEAEKYLQEAKRADKNKLLADQIKMMKDQMGMMDRQQIRYSR